MSCGIRTRDGASLLVRFVNHEGWLEARALDCSGGSVGRVVLCGLADDDAAAAAAPLRGPRASIGRAGRCVGAGRSAGRRGARARSGRRRRRRPSSGAGAGAQRPAPAPAPAAAGRPRPRPRHLWRPRRRVAGRVRPVPLRKVRFANTFQSGRFGAIDAVDGARARGQRLRVWFRRVRRRGPDVTRSAGRRDSAAWRVAELAAMRASIARSVQKRPPAAPTSRTTATTGACGRASSRRRRPRRSGRLLVNGRAA